VLRCRLGGPDGTWIGNWAAEVDPIVGDHVTVDGESYRVRQVLTNKSKFPVDTWVLVVPTVALQHSLTD
jgi:hypothetical protein